MTIILLSFIPLFQTARADLDTVGVARANQQGIALIHTMAVKVVETRKSPFINKGEEFLALEYTWTFRGGEERMHLRRYSHDSEEPMHQSDIVNSPTSGFRGIFGYDPNKAARLSESDDIGAQGQIDHYQAHPGSIGFNPRSSLLLGVAYFNQTYSLIDLVKRATKASCQRRVLNSGEMLYEIEVDMPEFGCSIQVDPQKSFMIQSVRQRFKKLNCESMAEAIDFKEGTGGVFFPTEVSGFLMENGKKMEQRSRIIELSVNETLPQGAFDLRFPKLLRVNDAVNNKIHVWGESGPNVTFDTIQEYHRWFVARARTEVAPPTLHDDWDSPPRERAPWRNFIIIGVSASSTLGIAIVVLRLVRARMRRDASLIED